MTSAAHNALEQQLIASLYREHHVWLLQWLSRRVRYPHHPSDILQDTFVKLIQAKHRLVHIQEPKAYLVNIAKHILIDQQRRYILEKNYLESLTQQLDIDISALDRKHLEEALDMLELLAIALKDVSPIAQEAFMLYYLDGYNQNEVAEKIGKSLRTTQTYLAQCLQLCFETKQKLIDA